MTGRKQRKPILNFYHNSPTDTSILPLLNISRNHHLHITPSRPQDLVLAESYMKKRPKTLFIDDSMGDSVSHCMLPSLLCSRTRGMIEAPDQCTHLEPSERQQWGSDLELASPIMTQMFNLPSLRSSTDEASMVISGGGSPTSSSYSIHNMEPSLWRQATMSPTSSPSLMDGTSQNIGVAKRSIGANSREEDGSFVDMKDKPKEVLDLVEDGDREREKGIHNFGPTITVRNSKNVELSFNMLSKYFDMPILEASKKLKVGLTVLKKRCRFFGIPRWPHRKMKSLNSLIHNIQDLAKEDGADDGIQVQDAVKELEKQRKEMEEIPSTQLLEKTKRLRQACFKASYKKRHQRAYTNGNSSNVFSKGNANTHYDRYIECQQAHTIDSDISIMTYAMLKSTLIPTSDNISRSSLLSKTTRR